MRYLADGTTESGFSLQMPPFGSRVTITFRAEFVDLPNFSDDTLANTEYYWLFANNAASASGFDTVERLLGIVDGHPGALQDQAGQCPASNSVGCNPTERCKKNCQGCKPCGKMRHCREASSLDPDMCPIHRVAPYAIATRPSALGLCQHAQGLRGKLQLSSNVYALSDGATVTLVQQFPSEGSPPITLVPDGGAREWRNLSFRCTRAHGIESVAGGIGNYPAVCTINPDACGGLPLVVRSREPGDRLTPYGMRGTKKVQDIFTDAKVPGHLRDTIPIVTCGGAIVWIPGFRIAQPFAVPDAAAPSLRIEAEDTSA
jgi:tRNA(Ile)-lysidine synthetase-like protein